MKGFLTGLGPVGAGACSEIPLEKGVTGWVTVEEGPGVD